MPVITNTTLNASSVDILNAIRNNATANYQNYVPVAEPNTNSMRAIGAILMDYSAIRNEFLSALINRIGLVLVKSKMYNNPWKAFKQGELEFGETIEEIFVSISQAFEFSPEKAETNIFARNIPDVRSAFHTLNYRKFYKQTIQREQLKQAFMSLDGVTNLIAKIVEGMYSAASYDEFLMMKYLLVRELLGGRLYPVTLTIPAGATEPEAVKQITTRVQEVSTDFTFMKSKYNVAAVPNYSAQDEQIIIMTSRFNARMNVEVLAAAFNLSYTDFLAQRVLIDSFSDFDEDRLNNLFKDADGNYFDGYTPLTAAEKAALDSIECVLVDKKYFMIFDNLIEFTENFNGEGLYWNYWLHLWKTFSVSPFENAAFFTDGTVAVSSIVIAPNADGGVTMHAGSSQVFTATVGGTNAALASKAVNWRVTTGEDIASVDIFGKVTISSEATNGASVVVTATSVYNDTISDSVNITVEA